MVAASKSVVGLRSGRRPDGSAGRHSPATDTTVLGAPRPQCQSAVGAIYTGRRHVALLGFGVFPHRRAEQGWDSLSQTSRKN